MSKTIDIKRAVSENRKVHFKFYQSSELWYQTEFDEVFTVPISDTGTGIFQNEDKAILFMRYMRKWNESLKT